MTTETLKELKEKATKLGVKFSANIGETSLQEKIDAHLAGEFTPPKDKPKELSKMEQIEKQRKQYMKLVRVQVSCNDPIRSTLHGTLITVGNAVYGTVKRFVPFNTTTHIEQWIYEVMQETMYQGFTTKTTNGNRHTQAVQLQAYNIAVLPQLTKQELADLADEQRKAELAGKG